MSAIDELARLAEKPVSRGPAPTIDTINFVELPDFEPPKRSFLIEGWLPAGCMSSLYGPGGVGKSLLTEQALACIATGMDFLGFKVERAPVLGLFAEDDDDELKRRQWRINQAYGLSNRDLGDFHVQGRAGLDNAMATFPAGAPRAEPLLEVIVKKMREIEARVVVLDNRAQMLLVNENDRAQATYAANLCASLCREVPNSSVLLLGHVAKAEGSEYSGSTAWDAVTRSRWWLRRAEGCEDDQQAPELILDRVKSNYAKPDSLRLAWTPGGILQPVEAHRMTGSERLDAELRKGAARQAFLDAMDKLNSQQRPVSHSRQAKNYAPKFMHSLGMVGDFSVRELEQAMEGLFADDRIGANQTIGRRGNRAPISGIGRLNHMDEVANDEATEEAA